jgi:hypothetical protein
MPPKKQKIDDHQRRSDEVAAVGDEFVASFDGLSVDVLANIFSFLRIKDTMSKRRINKKTMEAVKKTIPPTDFRVHSMDECNAMRVMTEAMPNLQQITIGDLGWGNKYNNGEDPVDEEGADSTAHYTTYNIEIISNFRKLRVLKIGEYDGEVGLNGRYPFLFNSFPLLQKLSINECDWLKWDLEMLAGMPSLKELNCAYNPSYLRGNISSLRVLKDTLEKVTIDDCPRVEGNFMDLADFPHLKELNLIGTAVTGDIRDIGKNDFLTLEQLLLPKGVYGGKGYQLQRISDGPDIVRAVYLLKKKIPALKMEDWRWLLSRDSPDWYESHGDDPPPFYIRFVQAGPRIGYRWTSHLRSEHGLNRSCEVSWLDPEPDRESSDYAKYIEELQEQEINKHVKIYGGFHQPPTEEEYNRLLDRFEEEGRWW